MLWESRAEVPAKKGTGRFESLQDAVCNRPGHPSSKESLFPKEGVLDEFKSGECYNNGC